MVDLNMGIVRGKEIKKIVRYKEGADLHSMSSQNLSRWLRMLKQSIS